MNPPGLHRMIAATPGSSSSVHPLEQKKEEKNPSSLHWVDLTPFTASGSGECHQVCYCRLKVTFPHFEVSLLGPSLPGQDTASLPGYFGIVAIASPPCLERVALLIPLPKATCPLITAFFHVQQIVLITGEPRQNSPESLK